MSRGITDQKVGGSNPSGRALLRQTTRPLSSENAVGGLCRVVCRDAESQDIGRGGPNALGKLAGVQPRAGVSRLGRAFWPRRGRIRWLIGVGFGTRRHDMARGLS